MAGKPSLRCINTNIIGSRILGYEIKTSIGTVALSGYRQEFSFFTQYVYYIRAYKPMPEISNQNQVIVIDVCR